MPNSVSAPTYRRADVIVQIDQHMLNTALLPVFCHDGGTAEQIGVLNTVDCLTGADAVSVIGEGQGIGAVGSRCKLSAFHPCEGISVVVIQRVADGVIGNGSSLIRSQQIAPVGVAVGIVIGADS